MGQKKEFISILVRNNYGVLARVSSLFGRRGFNIDTLTVSTTDRKDISRITATVILDEPELKQLVAQTGKLEEVLDIAVLDIRQSVIREIAVVKVRCTSKERSMIKEIVDIFKAAIVDLSPSSMIIEVTGKPSKINAFMRVISDYEILEVSRTGATAIQRQGILGKERIKNDKEIL